MEKATKQIVSYLKHVSQCLEEKNISCTCCPVGGGKSSLEERLKALTQRVSIYTLSANKANDSPLCHELWVKKILPMVRYYS